MTWAPYLDLYFTGTSIAAIMLKLQVVAVSNQIAALPEEPQTLRLSHPVAVQLALFKATVSRVVACSATRRNFQTSTKSTIRALKDSRHRARGTATPASWKENYQLESLSRRGKGSLKLVPMSDGIMRRQGANSNTGGRTRY